MDLFPSTSGSVSDVASSSGKHQRACDRCWKRKQKCDRLAPSCSTCRDSDVPCQPREVILDVEALPKDSTRAICHLSSYVNSLKRKTEELRGTLLQKRARLEPNQDGNLELNPAPPDDSLSHSGVGIASQSAHSTATAANQTQSYRGEDDDGSVHAAMGEIGYLSLGAMAEPRDSSRGLYQPLSLRTVLKAAVNVEGSEPYLSIIPSSASNSRRGRTELVPSSLTITRETTLEFLYFFIDQLGFRFPALGQNAIQYYDFTLPEGGSSHSVASCADLKNLISYNVIAIGILLSPESNTLKSLATKLHSATMDLIPRVLENEDPFVVLQFQLTLIIYSMYSPSGGSTWHLTGIAIRRCVALGYHRELDSREKPIEEEADSTRWIFWTLYIIDRTISSIMDRPFAIQDEEITVKIPNHSESPLALASQHIISHSQLITSIRSLHCGDIIFDWYNLSFWRGSFAASRTNFKSSHHISFHFQQLSCRTMTLLVDPTWLGESAIQGVNGVNIDREVQESCITFIRSLHDKLEEESFTGSFLDAYDVFSIGVVYLVLSFRLKSHDSMAESTEVISKCSTLLTIFTDQFRPLNVFRKILWAVHGVVMERCARKTPGSVRQPAGVPPMLGNFPTFIPGHLAELIKALMESDRLR